MEVEHVAVVCKIHPGNGSLLLGFPLRFLLFPMIPLPLMDGLRAGGVVSVVVILGYEINNKRESFSGCNFNH